MGGVETAVGDVESAVGDIGSTFDDIGSGIGDIANIFPEFDRIIQEVGVVMQKVAKGVAIIILTIIAYKLIRLLCRFKGCFWCCFQWTKKTCILLAKPSSSNQRQPPTEMTAISKKKRNPIKDARAKAKSKKMPNSRTIRMEKKATKQKNQKIRK